MGRKRELRTAIPPPLIPGCIWIPLTKSEFALIDEVDFDKIKHLSWQLSPNKKVKYAKSDRIYMHTLLMDGIKGVDHINGNGLDNRRANLRVANHHQNGGNVDVKKSNTSGIKGVSWDKNRNKWVAQIHVLGKHFYLGRFEDINEAAKAYKDAALKYFGEFVRKYR